MTAIETTRGDLETLATVWQGAAEHHERVHGGDPKRSGWMVGLVRTLAGLSAPWNTYDPSLLAERAHVRVLRHPRFDAWLLAWPTSGRTDLHDHGGAAGAFAVVDGELMETWLATQHLRARVVEMGAAVSFGASHIHDVVNARLTPATSVHVYAPPISSMTHFARSAGSRAEPAFVEDVPDRALRELTRGPAGAAGR